MMSRRPAPRSLLLLIAAAAAVLFMTPAASASTALGQISWPSMDDIARVLTFRDHATRVVVLGTMMLGLAAGILGTYMLLRRRALIGDALSHATLPGIAIAFLVMVAFGGSGKFLPGLLLGAAVCGFLGVGAILLITNATRIRQDAALGIVLSVAFGLGIALLGIIQKMPIGGQAGLADFISGRTASMVVSDAMFIGITALIAVVACTLLYKEFALLSFDPDFAGALGWPTGRLDVIMMALVTIVTVVGLQAVGAILIIALLIIPPAAARYWTNSLRIMLIVSASIGACSGFFGAIISALIQGIPAGAIIVVIAAMLFGFSMLFGARRGAVLGMFRSLRVRHRVLRQHLLRAMYERAESHRQPHDSPIPIDDLAPARSWSPAQLHRVIRRAERRGEVDLAADRKTVRLTRAGIAGAAQIVRNHRLWELYLIAHAEIAASHVDRNADQIEHVLDRDMILELEALASTDPTLPAVPPSPHALASNEGAPA